jgi:DNA-binding beta-propeller fold protein YncE
MPLSRITAVAVFLAVGSVAFGADPPPVSYYKDVRPILQHNCQGCHQPARAQGGCVLTDVPSMFKPGENGKRAVVPGKPEASFLMEEIRVSGGKAEMPKGRDPLIGKQYQTIELWIRQGAKDDTPASATASAIDAEHPPVYPAPPVVTAVAYSPGGDLLAVTGYHEILLHKPDGSGVVGRLVGLSERVQSIAFSPDGTRLAACGGDPGRFGEVQIWDVAKKKLILSTPLTFDTLYGISWSPDGQTVAVGCADNTVRAIDALTGKQVLQMGTHSDWVLGTAFSRDGRYLASVSRDMSVKLTEVATQRFIDNVTSITPGALKGGLMAIAIRPKTAKWFQKLPEDTPGVPRKMYDEFLCAGADGMPRLYKMHREKKREIGDDANKIRDYEPMTGRISSLAFDRSGKRFAAASSLDGKGDVWVYETDTGKPAVKCEGITGPAYAVAWHPNGTWVASAGFDGVVWINDATTGKQVMAFGVVPK